MVGEILIMRFMAEIMCLLKSDEHAPSLRARQIEMASFTAPDPPGGAKGSAGRTGDLRIPASAKSTSIPSLLRFVHMRACCDCAETRLRAAVDVTGCQRGIEVNGDVFCLRDNSRRKHRKTVSPASIRKINI